MCAFGGEDEAGIVSRLRAAARLRGELVAVADGELVGHIAFSPVSIDHHRQERHWGLAPLGVAPQWQRQGIGARLVRDGLRAAAAAGVELVVVLGEPDYYRRFGFAPASLLGLCCTYPAPPDCFMALRLGARPLPTGTVRYDPALDG